MAKKCTKIYNALAQPLFWSLNLLFGNVLVAVAVAVAVAVVVFLNSLIGSLRNHDGNGNGNGNEKVAKQKV